MPSIIDIEKAASRLRQNLRATPIPELRLLCGLRFFALSAGDYRTGLESYLREFTSQLAEAAHKSRPAELLPEEAEGLNRFIDLIKAQPPAIVGADDISAFDRLLEAIRTGAKTYSPEPAAPKGAARVRCLFVEHYPDLDLAPRGRILDLTVTAVKMPAKAEDDDIVVRNPLYEPDDRFLAQARESIKAARAYLLRRHGLPLRKRYRFDLAVDSSGARFTGDSLGVAFAVGAVAAVAAIEVFRERLSVSPTAAFSGALSADGKIEPIDGEALKLKIYRAFHSNLDYLVIPRQHIIDAWEYLATLEKGSPGRKLELVGADDLAAVISDPRLLPVRRSSTPAFVARKALAARRSVWVEIPALAILAAILFILLAPARWMPWFDDNPAYADIDTTQSIFRVYNQDRYELWKKKFRGHLIFNSPQIWKIANLDDDSAQEVLFLPPITDDDAGRGWCYYYDDNGDPMCSVYCGINNWNACDTGRQFFSAEHVSVVINEGMPMIITEVASVYGSHSFIKSWDAGGNPVGSYINAGGTHLKYKSDLNDDGITELVFFNYYNPLQCLSVAIFRADSINGASPPYEDTCILGSDEIRGSQLCYILLPTSDLGKIDIESGRSQPDPDGVRQGVNSTLDIYSGESRESPNSCIIYHVERNFRVTRVIPTEQFVKRRDELVAAGALPKVDMSEYLNALRDSVQYWTDSGWVTEAQRRAIE